MVNTDKHKNVNLKDDILAISNIEQCAELCRIPRNFISYFQYVPLDIKRYNYSGRSIDQYTIDDF